MNMRSPIGGAGFDAPPSVNAQAASQEEGTWFEAPTRFGRLRLRTASGVARHAAEAALALDRCEPLLASLDAWTGLDLAWCWSTARSGRLATGSGACAVWRSDAGAGPGPSPSGGSAGLIVWPWGLLRALPAPAQALAQQLQWSAVPVLLSIAQLRISIDELRQLEPGGAVLLPPSLRPAWLGMLRSAGESTYAGFGVPVSLESLFKPRLVKIRARADATAAIADPSSAAGDGDMQLCEVRLATHHAVAGDQLTGWFDTELGEAGPQASLWRCATPSEAAFCMAIGRLMPWGHGWALALEALCEEENQVIAKLD